MDDQSAKKEELDAGDASPEGAERSSEGVLSRVKLRHIIYGSLVSTGAMSLGAWNAQAHGNRSSHDTAQILWGVDRYVINRELLLAPSAATTIRLNDLVTRLDRLQFPVTGSLSPTPLPVRPADTPDRPALGPSVRAAPTTSLRDVQAEISSLTKERAALEAQLQLTPTTKRVLGLLSQKKEADAIAAIEGQRDVSDVLSSYVFAQLDLYNLSFVDGKSTTKTTEDIATISRAAIKYFDRIPKKSADVKRAGAGILHNYSSFAFPDVGNVSERIQKEGREAGRRALALRMELAEPRPIANARIMVGIQQLRSRELEGAEREFRAALAIAKRARGFDEMGWSQAYLGRTLKARGGPERKKEADALFAGARLQLARDPASLPILQTLEAP